MSQGNNNSKSSPPLNARDSAQFALQQYRHYRVQENVRRTFLERSAANGPNYTNVVEAASEPENPRRRAALHEVAILSAFEYVHYNLAETVPQEVAQGLQMDRDMKNPGIYSDGARVSDILHLPPSHAILPKTYPERIRPSRDVHPGDAPENANNPNISPLPRPYVPQGIVDAEGEPQWDFHKRRAKRQRSESIRQSGEAFHEANRSFQDRLSQISAETKPRVLTLAEVQLIVSILQQYNLDIEDGRSMILRALKNLDRYCLPDDKLIRDSGIGIALSKLRSCPDEGIAEHAKVIIDNWREYTRKMEGWELVTSVPNRNAFADPFSSFGGRNVPDRVLKSIIGRKKLFSQGYNSATSSTLAYRIDEDNSDLRSERRLDREENCDAFEDRMVERAVAGLATPQDVPRDSRPGRNTVPETGDSEASVLVSFSSAGSTLIPNSYLGNQANIGNQGFEIFEEDASPERPVVEQTGRILVPQSDVVQIEGPCHPCPEFPGTFHHIYTPENPACVDISQPQTISQSTPADRNTTVNDLLSGSRPDNQSPEAISQRGALALAEIQRIRENGSTPPGPFLSSLPVRPHQTPVSNSQTESDITTDIFPFHSPNFIHRLPGEASPELGGKAPSPDVFDQPGPESPTEVIRRRRRAGSPLFPSDDSPTSTTDPNGRPPRRRKLPSTRPEMTTGSISPDSRVNLFQTPPHVRGVRRPTPFPSRGFALFGTKRSSPCAGEDDSPEKRQRGRSDSPGRR